MNPEYARIFTERGGLYDAAMRLVPDARKVEFTNLLTMHRPTAGETVVDIPAGGGYLKRHLDNGVVHAPLEIAEGFGAEEVPIVEWDADWPAPAGDHVVCVAALHHYEDHAEALARLMRAAKPGGIVHIADVPRSSSIARFLDDFVGAHNGTGHDGNYLPDAAADMPHADKLERCEVLPCPWTFKDRDEMIAFAELLFGLKGPTDDEIFDALSRFVGVEESDAACVLTWSLLYADYRV